MGKPKGSKVAGAERDEIMNKLVKRREQMFTQIRSFSRFVDSLVDDPGRVVELELRLESVQPLYQEFNSIIVDLKLLDDDFDVEQHKEWFETEYFRVVSQAKQILKLSSESERSRLQCSAVPNVEPVFNASVPFAKLPILGVPKFSGEYEKWTQFSETFHVLVHSNPQLDEIQKFYYLLDSLEGGARKVLDCLEVSRANYSVALKLLEERFFNKGVIIQSHLKAMFDVSSINKPSHSMLRNLVDLILKHTRALKALGEPTESWDRLIIFFMSRKLDSESKLEWEKLSVSDFNNDPSLKHFTDFIVNRCRILEAIDGSSRTFKTQKSVNSGTFVAVNNKHVKCEICKEPHFVYACEKLKSLSVPDRIQQVKRSKLCLNCLRSSHLAYECRSEGCRKCKQRHNTLLHLDKRNTDTAGSTNQNVSNSGDLDITPVANHSSVACENPVKNDLLAVASCNTFLEHTQVVLSTAVVQIEDKFGRFVKCRALLDSGSQINFISKPLAVKLGLNLSKTNVSVTGVGQRVTDILYRVHSCIKSAYNDYKADLFFLVMDNITSHIPVKSFSIENLDIPSGIKLADPDFNKSANIDLLIGAGIFYELLCVGQIKLGINQPILHKSVLGWLVSGPIQGTRQVVSASHVAVEQDVQSQLEKFWSIEECAPVKLHSGEELECEEVFVNSVRRSDSGRFSVALPLKDNYNKLGSSFENASRRLRKLEKRLNSDLDLKTKYSSFIKEYQDLNHMTLIEKENLVTENPTYYLPHHAVVNESSITTKLRVVFDGSAKSDSGLSLNDILKVGPTVQEDLVSILIRFRQKPIVVQADIEKMYRQVDVLPEYRDLQRILWRSNSNNEIEHFRLNTLTYGTAPASFLATRCLKQIALDIQNQFPKLSKIINTNFYVDDLIVTFDSIEEAIEIATGLARELDKYKFPLRKWASNRPEVLEALSREQAPTQGYFITDNNTRKTLGVYWKADTDDLEFVINITPINQIKVTKRAILSLTSQIFDPLGLVGPITIRAKVILQKLWQLKLDWDEAIPINLFTMWNNFYSDMEMLNDIKIPRQCEVNNASYFELHGFSDASSYAYGAAIYLRSINDNGEVLSNLICAKSRVAPVKTVSLPRLELCGALLLSKLSQKILSTIEFKISKVFLWSDSTIVLSWISQEPSTWKVFTANRVSEIQLLTKEAVWNHVSSKENPADIISRGVNSDFLKTSKLWWHGPEWLLAPVESWPKTDFTNSNEEIPDKRKETRVFTASLLDLSLFTRFSSLYRLKRYVGWCFRFCTNARREVDGRIFGDLTVAELDNSLFGLIKFAQQQMFRDEINQLESKGCVSRSSSLKTLDPFIDNNNILRVGGRLVHSNLSYDVKHPILLPKCHPLTRLIIRDYHQRQLHAGPQAILTGLRQKFWIINGRNEVRSVLSKCITCFRTKPVPMFQKMGNLPRDRVICQRPFSVCGIDFAGPFNVKDGKLRNRSVVKGYMCLFICFVTKAVHIELVGDLSTASFLDALKRFVSRRGLCSKIYSDNGTNFIGANNDLKRISQTLSGFGLTNEVQTYCKSQSIEWQYIPPRSPHQGGLWESSIKSAKRLITRIIGNSVLTFEQLSTVFCQVESVLNSRPLTPLSTNPNDLEPLTPGHFLIGTALNSIPQVDVSAVPTNRLSKYQLLQQMVQQLWSRWSNEYLTNLQARYKWLQGQKVPIGALVILKEENVPPLQWKMGRIIAAHPGADGLIRVVEVRTSNGVVKRAVQKVCVLPMEDEKGE